MVSSQRLALIACAIQLVAPRDSLGDEDPWLLDGDELIEGVPTRGVLPIVFENETPTGLNPDWEVVVTDGNENIVAGSTEVTFDRLVWRSAAPLEPLTVYTAEVRFAVARVDVPFRTAADDTEPEVDNPEFAPVSLRETHAVDRRVCCDIVVGDEDDCFSGPSYQCVGFTFKPAILASSRDATGAVEQRYLSRVENAPFWRLLDPDPSATEYCIDITIRNLLDESTVVSTLCGFVEDVTPSQVPLPELALADICRGPAVDEETGEPVTDGDSGGCSTTGGRGSGTFLGLLVLVGLFIRREQPSKNYIR